MINQTISNFKILEKLGSGGMGVVYKAEDTKLERTVALKFLPQGLTRDEEAKKRFMYEAQAASALDHPNIGTIYEVEQTDMGQMFIVMAYYDGETLGGKIERGPQPIDEAIDISLQIAQGLAEAHGKEIVHRDIKPANIMMTTDKVVKIVDFGLAKLAGRTKLTKDDSTLGTVAYMSPEQAQGAEVDHRTDIWALGAVLYEMISGRQPFEGEYEQAVMYSIMNEDPEPITGLRTGVPMELERTVNKCLEKEPSDRYQQVIELIVDLRRLKKETESKKILARTGVKAKTPKKRTRTFVLTGILLGVLILAVAGYFFFAPGETEPTSERKMLAVLPFENLGPPEQEYFSDGITEEIISRLAGIRALGVISRTSITQYKQTDKTLQQIGEELGVGYVLEGTVRWDHSPDGPGRVRVTPQLIRVSDDTHLWSDRYNAVLTDIFQVQSDIAERVSEVMNVAVLASERRSLESIPTDNLEAYDAYLR
ncbi:MAG: protein kinase, partial [bacterium]